MRPPISGTMVITQLFGGNPENERYTTKEGNLVIGHSGIDIGCPMGTLIYPAANGIVQILDTTPYGFGLHILLVDTRGRRFLYGHLSEILVKNGEKVAIHTPIAKSGSSGNSTGPHLHFEVHEYPEDKENGYNGARDPLGGFDHDVLKNIDLSLTNL